MSVSQMVERAHEQAKLSGFWQELSWIMESISPPQETAVINMAVSQKLALIATEVMEFESEYFGSPHRAGGSPENPDAMLEELADVLIRTFDLVGFLGITLPEFFTGSRSRLHSSSRSSRSVTVYLYREIASAVQAMRKNPGDPEAPKEHLSNVCLAAQDFATHLTYDVYALRRAVKAKMEKNRSREHKHGAAF